MRAGNNGITAETVNNIQFGAGTIHKGLKFNSYVELTTEPADFSTNYQKYYTKSGSGEPYTYTPLVSSTAFASGTYYAKTWNFDESCVGATKGGSSVKIEPEFYTVQPDGSAVAVKNFKRKTGEKATMDVNLLELNPDMIKASVIGADGVSDIEGMGLIVSKDAIVEGDYWENIAFVGETLDGKNIIVILPNALCTSGLSIEGKSGEESVGKFTFECHGDANESLTTLPYKIYYPTVG